MNDPVIRELLRMVDQAFDKRAWHGTNLRGSIRRITAAQSVWRPEPGRHNIRELVLHCAYWKYAVTRRLTGGKRGGFAIAGSNWFSRSDPADAAGWRAEVALLDRTHRALRRVIETFPASRLGQKPKGSKFTFSETIAGVASHDLYHAGQIQLIKRLLAARGR
jgi:uncharacterized damage-inducible protein DinB